MELMEHTEYLIFASELLNQFQNYSSNSIRISFDKLKTEPHEQLMNRLAKCRQEHADAMFIHFNKFSLVLVHGNASKFVYKYASVHSKGNLTMSEMKHKNDWFWTNEAYSQNHVFIRHENAGRFHVWEHPYLIRAKTDKVSNYYKIWRNGILVDEGDEFGSTENFYIIGSIHIYEK